MDVFVDASVDPWFIRGVRIMDVSNRGGSMHICTSDICTMNAPCILFHACTAHRCVDACMPGFTNA
jgi:hypothetical protein